jgi:hypothetical protein
MRSAQHALCRHQDREIMLADPGDWPDLGRASEIRPDT